MIEVKPPGEDVLEALGLGRRKPKRRKKGAPTCHDCFFHKNVLCALDLDEPCSTFRADDPAGLVPPRQPALLVRQGEDGLEASVEVTAA